LIVETPADAEADLEIGREEHVGAGAEKVLRALALALAVVDTKRDWKAIYPFEKR